MSPLFGGTVEEVYSWRCETRQKCLAPSFLQKLTGPNLLECLLQNVMTTSLNRHKNAQSCHFYEADRRMSENVTNIQGDI